MAMAWTELCRDLSDEHFLAACKAHLRESKFFPCPADILTAAENLRPSRPPVLALEEHTMTRGDMRTFAVNSAMIQASLQGAARAKDYFKTDDPEEREAIAAEVLGSRYVDGEIRRRGDARRFMQ